METYHERENQRRFAVYLNGKLHTETADRAHANYLLGLYDTDNPTIRVFTANQETSPYDPMLPPKHINGGEVLMFEPRARSGPNTYRILVKRDHPYHPFVVASWSPDTPEVWYWGYYHKTLREAVADFNLAQRGHRS